MYFKLHRQDVITIARVVVLVVAKVVAKRTVEMTAKTHVNGVALDNVPNLAKEELLLSMDGGDIDVNTLHDFMTYDFRSYLDLLLNQFILGIMKLHFKFKM